MNAGWAWLTDAANWSGADGIPVRLAEHVGYTLLVLAVSLLIGLPLGLLIAHAGPRWAFAVINTANGARALPTLGLLVLIFLLSTGSSVAALIPLVVLAVPPILINVYEGVRQVEPQVRDAARGMGMTGRQVLLRVELPIATPLILLGVRTAAVQVVATATVAAYINLGGLGGYIMDGILLREYGEAVGGSVLVVLLAIAVQGIFTLLTRLVTPRGLRKDTTS
ncbi:osmoprotectant transport system permease protein [Actinocorallia herbida]|uniref:Osmoprotectant transport system permease protein n=1 Tax=Actinocorallia herbida TaxID=58109 RepID=A0A3N1CPK4_9ACTN|nr:ABC transporter permease [Actinocorallia herbida]ROO83251.1 osmoprotectant transport system permease protein [Actinocorallia herbida]